MQHESTSARLFHLLSRYAYLQDLLEHQRVLVLGNAEAASAEALDRQGIKRAVFIDSSDDRVKEARRRCSSRRVEFMVGPFARVALVEDSFDVAIIEDFGRLESRERDLASAKRGLTPSGVLVACIQNPESGVGLTSVASSGLGYYEFYGQLADSFPFVRMIGQCPLVGFALADLAVDDPDASITFDSSMLEEGSEDAEFFVALCSRTPINADPFAVVQVPLKWVDGRRLMGSQTPPKEAHKDKREKRPAREKRAEELPQPQQDSTSEKINRLERELKRKGEEASKEIARVKLELDKKAVSIAKLENHLREAREKASLEHDRVVQTKIALEAEKKKLLGLEKEFEMERRIQKMAPGEVEEKDREPPRRSRGSSESKARVQALEKELESARREKAKLLQEVEGLEAQLDEAGDTKLLDVLEAELNAEKKLRKKAESKAADLESRGSRADGLAADLAKERGARKLAESHASELEKKLRASKQSPAAKSLSPAKEALKKAEAAFTSRATSEQFDALRSELLREQEARASAEARLEELGRDDAAFRAQEELSKERAAREAAEEAKSELLGKLSKVKTEAARLRAVGEARQRAESAFQAVGGLDQQVGAPPGLAFEPTQEIPAKAMTELTNCLEEKGILEAELEQVRSRCRELELEAQKASKATVDQRALEKELGVLRSQVSEFERVHQDLRQTHLDDGIDAVDDYEQTADEKIEDEVVEALRLNITREEQRRREIEEDLTSIESDHGREISQIERTLKERGAEVAELKEKLDHQSDVLIQLLDDMRSLGSQSPDLEAGLERRDAELLELRARLESAERESARLQLEIAQRDQSLTDLEGELQGHKWQISELELSAAREPSVTREEEDQSQIDVPVLSLGGRRLDLQEPAGGADFSSGGFDRELARAQGKAEALETERTRHVMQLEALRAEIAGAQRQMITFEVESRAAKDHATSCLESLKEAENRCRDLESRTEQANTRASAMERKAAEAVGQLHVVERELEASHRGQQEAKRELGELRQELGGAGARRAELEAQCRRLERDLSVVKKEAESSSRDLVAAQACVAMLEEQIPGVSDLLGEIRADETSEFPALSLRSISLRDSSGFLRQRQESHLSSSPAAPSDVKLLSEQLAKTRSELDRAKTRETVLQARLDEYTEALGRRDNETTTLSRRVVELEQELASASERSARLMGELAKAQAAASLAREELNDLNERADSAVLESAGTSAQVEQLRGNLAHAETSADVERQACSTAIAELDGAKLEIAQLRDELQRAVAQLEQTEAPSAPDIEDAEIEGIQRLLASCRQACAQHEGEAVGLGFKVRELESSLSEARSIIAKAKYEHDTSREDAEESATLIARISKLESETTRLKEHDTDLSERLKKASEELSSARHRAAELEYVDQHANEWAGRLESAEREGEKLRSELDELRTVCADSKSSSVEALSFKEQLAQVNEQLEIVAQERRDAEDALERVVDNFSDVSGDAAALIDVLQDRDDLIQRLEQSVAMQKKKADEACTDGSGGKGETGVESREPDTLESCLRKLEAARRVVESLEADKRRLGALIDELKSAGGV